MFERSEWITSPPNADGVFCFRRCFSYSTEAAEAVLFFTADHPALLFFNGKVLGKAGMDKNENARAVFRKDVVSLLYQGKNVLGVLCEAGTAFCLSVRLTEEEGEKTEICSDSLWGCMKSPYFRRLSGENEEFSLGKNALDFLYPGFDDSGYDSVSVCLGDGKPLYQTSLTSCTHATLFPAALLYGVYDFGTQLYGGIAATVEGKAADELRFTFSQRIDQCGNQVSPLFTDTYRLSGDKKEESLCSLLAVHPFRYVSVSGMRDGIPFRPEIKALTARAEKAPLTQSGSFSCSVPAFERMFSAAAASMDYALTAQDPDNYPNIGFLTFPFYLYDKPSVDKIVSSLLNRLSAVQLSDGRIGSAKQEFSPAAALWQGAALALFPYEEYLFYGETEWAENFLRAAERFLAFLRKNNEDGLIRLEIPDQPLSPYGDICPSSFLLTALFCRLNDVMATLCTVLKTDSTAYDEAAAAARTAFRERFMEDGELLIDSQTALAVSVAFKLCDHEECAVFTERLKQSLTENPLPRVGVLGMGCLIHALGEQGETDFLLSLFLRNEGPFSRILAACPGTLPGDFSCRGSLISTVLCEVGTVFFRYVAGIRPSAHSLVVAPAFPGSIPAYTASACGVTVETADNRLCVSSDCPFLLLFGEEKRKLSPGTYNFSRK
ncbi:MAG: family 78 glycoside hydrolase catalytic domain [Clostridia bacterium]|nr:family 78 glycoside hydrolase catalytic domain [Clostridia bacterium]